MSGVGRVLAISDDLTGAVACGAELRRAGLRAVVRPWDRLAADEDADALVVDTGSRLLASELAVRRVRTAVADGRAALGAGAIAYKRLDSGLRGHVGAELGAFRAAVGLPVVVAPAAPAYGITTVDAVQCLDGEPLSPRAYGDVGEGPAGADVTALLPAPAARLTLADVRGEGLAAALAEALAAAAFVVCDAESTADLAALARVLAALREPVAVAGSYGLAGALAAAGPRPSQPRVLVVAGSLQAATARQLAELAADDAGVEVRSTPPLAAGGAANPAVAAALAAEALARVRARRPAALVLVGGETAAALLAAAGTEAVEMLAEPWPATPLVRLVGGELDGLPAIVKSGARGDARWLVHAVDVVRRTIP